MRELVYLCQVAYNVNSGNDLVYNDDLGGSSPPTRTIHLPLGGSESPKLASKGSIPFGCARLVGREADCGSLLNF